MNSTTAAKCGGVLFLLLLMILLGKYIPENSVERTLVSNAPVSEITKAPPSEMRIFGFNHSRIKDCRDMYKFDVDRETRISKITTSMEMLNKEALKYEKELLGNSGQKPSQLLFFNTVAKASFIKTICETGFNAGHGTYMWLSSNPMAQVYSFTLGTEKYNKPMAEFINKLFPGRHHIIFGDSKKTIPEFTKKHPELKCDLIYIDGGHEYPEAIADFTNLRVHANRDYHMLVSDDITATGVYKTWRDEKKNGNIVEHFQCEDADRRYFLSMAVGAYKFKK